MRPGHERGRLGGHYASDMLETESLLCSTGAVADWPACAKWKGDAGLARLEALAGDAEVQVGLSVSCACSEHPQRMRSIHMHEAFSL